MTDAAAEVLTVALRAVLLGAHIDVDAIFTADVVTWSPSTETWSRAELVTAFEEAAEDAESVWSDIEFTVDSLVVVTPDAAVAEWTLQAVHTGPLLVADDVLIEPSGRRVVLAGASFADFRGARIRALRTYFDDAAFIEQLTQG